MGGTLALGLLWHLMRNRSKRRRSDELRAAYGLDKESSHDPWDQLLDAVAHDCPVLCGFVMGCMDKGASFEQTVIGVQRGVHVCDKFAEAWQAAQEPLDRLIVAANWLCTRDLNEKTASILSGMLTKTGPGGLALRPFDLYVLASRAQLEKCGFGPGQVEAMQSSGSSTRPGAGVAPSTRPEWSDPKVRFGTQGTGPGLGVGPNMAWEGIKASLGNAGRSMKGLFGGLAGGVGTVVGGAGNMVGIPYADTIYQQSSEMARGGMGDFANSLGASGLNTAAEGNSNVGNQIEGQRQQTRQATGWDKATDLASRGAEAAGEFAATAVPMAGAGNIAGATRTGGAQVLTPKNLIMGSPAVGAPLGQAMGAAVQGVQQAGLGAKALYGQAAQAAGRAGAAAKAVPGVGQTLKVLGSPTARLADLAGSITGTPLGPWSGGFWASNQIGKYREDVKNQASIDAALADPVIAAELQPMLDEGRQTLAAQGITGADAEHQLRAMVAPQVALMMAGKDDLMAAQQETQRATEMWDVARGLQDSDETLQMLIQEATIAGMAAGKQGADLDKYVNDMGRQIVAARISVAAQGGAPLPPALASLVVNNNTAAFGIKPDALAAAGPEAGVQVAGAVDTVVKTVNNMGPQKFGDMQQQLASGDTTTPAAQHAIKTMADSNGMSLESALEAFTNMDTGSKVLAGLGLALGTIGLISALTDEDGGPMSFLTSALGFGAVAGMLAHGGVFGQEAQQFTKGLMAQLGMGGDEWKPPETPEGVVQAAGTPEPTQLPGGAETQAQPAAATPQAAGQPPAAVGLTPDKLQAFARRFRLPMGEGDPNTFDMPDQEALLTNFIRSGTHTPAIQQMAGQMSPQQKAQLHAAVQKSIADLPGWKRTWFDNDRGMQSRYKWLMGL